jgi:hypothetical protein
MTEPQKPNADDLTRIIVLIYGTLEGGSPFWVYAAIKPSKYQGFQLAKKENKINLHEFTSFGEIIVSGEGKSPPDEITLKVAEMYQTEPEKMFQPIDPEKEIEKKMNVLSAALEPKK